MNSQSDARGTVVSRGKERLIGSFTTLQFVFLCLSVVVGRPGAASPGVSNLGIAATEVVELNGEWAAFGASESLQGADLNRDGDLEDSVLHFCGPSGSLVNTELAVLFETLVASSDLALFLVIESSQGRRDLNGDMDASDLVLHAYDFGAERIENVGVALSIEAKFGVSERFAVIPLDEGDRGLDLNGDGDRFDRVLHVYDGERARLVNLGLAWGGFVLPAFSRGRLVFWALEVNQGADLNGDGDTSDFVLQNYDSRSGITTNLSIASSSGEELVGTRDLSVFLVQESSQGMDLNQDGDLMDSVPHVLDRISLAIFNLGRASGGEVAEARGNLVVFGVLEAADGQRDLNGDGDFGDLVLQVFNVLTGVTTNLGLALTNEERPTILRNAVLFRASEAQQGADLNGDQDLLDRIDHAHDVLTGHTINLGLVSARAPVTSEDIAVFEILEAASGVDLNGDGDDIDSVLHVYRPDSGTFRNLGFASRSFAVHRDLVGFSVVEAAQGGSDLNGDGDLVDTVVHLFRDSHDEILNLGVASFSVPQLSESGNLLVQVSESSQGGEDLNGDGSVGGDVLHLYRTVDGRLTNLGFFTNSSPRLSGDRVVLPVTELSLGRDQNGDGDLHDVIVHLHDSDSGLTLNSRLATVEPPGLNREGSCLLVSEEAQGRSDLNGDGDTFDSVVHWIGLSSSDSFGAGSVNAGVGEVRPVLRINEQTGTVSVRTRDAIQLSLLAAPAGPAPGRYLLWVWFGLPSAPHDLRFGARNLGGVVDATPLRPLGLPGPAGCLLGQGMPAVACSGVPRVRSAPRFVPFVRNSFRGLSRPTVITLQGLIEDLGASNSLSFSVTNAVTLQSLR